MSDTTVAAARQNPDPVVLFSPRSLALAALAIAVMIAAINGDSIWFLNFIHVLAGILWTGIDLFMGLIVGPVLRRLDLRARRALIAGDLDVTFSAVGRVEKGRMLAVTSEKRFPFAADTPTLKELGYDIGNKVAWRGILIRKGVPADRKAYLINAIRKATAKPAWKAFTNKLRAKQSLVCGADFAKLVKDEIVETTRYYKELGIVK